MPLPPAGAQPPMGPSEAGLGAPSWSTKDKPLSSEQLEPTYRKGSECWSEGTGRGSSRAFLGTPGLKFALETEEKIKKLLRADLKCFSTPHITLVARGDSGAALKSPSPTMACPFQHPHSSPSRAVAPLLLDAPPPSGQLYTRLEPTGASSSRKPCLYICSTPSSHLEIP